MLTLVMQRVLLSTYSLGKWNIYMITDLGKDISWSFQLISFLNSMNLFILRHGEAGKFSDGNDFVRPLTDAGTTDGDC